MRVREAVSADADAVREVHERSIRGLGPEAYDREQVEAWARGCASADYAAAIDDAAVFLVAEAEDDVAPERAGQVVAFGSLSLDTPDGYETDADAEVTGVYVDPTVARRGVGTAVHGELEERARGRGVGTLALSASRNAVPFYEALGYERVRAYDHEFSPHESTGVTGTVVEMRKRLE